MVVIQMFEWVKQKQQRRNLYVNGNTQRKRQSSDQINEDVDFGAMEGELTLLGIGRLCRGGGGSCCLLRRVGGWFCGTIVLPGDK